MAKGKPLILVWDKTWGPKRVFNTTAQFEKWISEDSAKEKLEFAYVNLLWPDGDWRSDGAVQDHRRAMERRKREESEEKE